ncbi:MAG: hypothetical protein Crog4KO_34400 [Crocinitomicaceae bacterium]
MNNNAFPISITNALIVLLIVLAVFILIVRRLSPSKKQLKKIEAEISEASKANQRLKVKEYIGILFPVDVTQYTRYYIVKGNNEQAIIDQLTEYGELNHSKEYQEFKFNIGRESDFFVVQVDAKLNFDDFHNASFWIETHVNVERVYGLAIHESDPDLSYYHHMDYDKPNGDTQIGTFGAKGNFFVYLPEAYEECGNLKISEDVKIHFPNPSSLLSFVGVSQAKLNSLQFNSHVVKIYH